MSTIPMHRTPRAGVYARNRASLLELESTCSKSVVKTRFALVVSDYLERE